MWIWPIIGVVETWSPHKDNTLMLSLKCVWCSVEPLIITMMTLICIGVIEMTLVPLVTSWGYRSHLCIWSVLSGCLSCIILFTVSLCCVFQFSHVSSFYRPVSSDFNNIYRVWSVQVLSIQNQWHLQPHQLRYVSRLQQNGNCFSRVTEHKPFLLSLNQCFTTVTNSLWYITAEQF